MSIQGPRRTFLGIAILAAGLLRTAAPAPAQEVTVAVSMDPVTLDPRLANGMPAISLVHHLADKLIFVDTKLNLVPQLATSWEWRNPTTLRLHLRKGVKFHNGEPFTAESVKYTLETTLSPQSTSWQKPFLRAIDQIEILDDYTVDLKTKTPYRPLAANLTYPGMVPPKAGKALGKEMGTKVVGAGPFKLVEYLPGQRVVM